MQKNGKAVYQNQGDALALIQHRYLLLLFPCRFKRFCAIFLEFNCTFPVINCSENPLFNFIYFSALSPCIEQWRYFWYLFFYLTPCYCISLKFLHLFSHSICTVKYRLFI